MTRLSAAGLNAIPLWLQPFVSLSGGQQERANVALGLDSAVALDDFGAVIDSHVRHLLAASIARLVRRMGLTRVVVATSDRDVVRWLQPDLMITLDAEFGSLQRNPCRDTPPRPRVSIRYVTDRFDVATPSAAQLNGADPLTALVEAAGGVVDEVFDYTDDQRYADFHCRAVLDKQAREAAHCMSLALSEGERVTTLRLPTPSSRRVLELLASPSDAPRTVCLCGASGTGKSLLLQTIAQSATRLPAIEWIPDCTVAQQIADAAGLPSLCAAAEALAMLGLGAHASTRARKLLSAGEASIADSAMVIATASTAPGCADLVCIDEERSRASRTSRARSVEKDRSAWTPSTPTTALFQVEAAAMAAARPSEQRRAPKCPKCFSWDPGLVLRNVFM